MDQLKRNRINTELGCNAPTDAAAKDLVPVVPGFSGSLPSCEYSGFVNVNMDMNNFKVHYYYIESENNPEKDPLILWSNGGPGASSMYGMMTEVGPFLLNDDSLKTDEYKETGIPTLFRNPQAWTLIGNLVIFDWPPPVGFSYCYNNIKGEGSSCGDWNDERMAEVSYLALKGFLNDLFPNLLQQKNPLFLTGESYAGIYIPKLAEKIIYNSNMEEWNLKGFAVGDACVGTEVLCGPKLDIETFGPWYEYLFLYGHGQFSNKLWEELISACGVDHLQYVKKEPIDSQKCEKAQEKVSKQVGGYWEYNLYDDCTYENNLLSSIPHPFDIQRLRKISARQKYAPTSFERRLSSLNEGVNDYICGEGIAQDVWTSHPSVREALHVNIDSNFVSGDNAEGMPYTLTEKNLMPFYHSVIMETSLRVMVYNGDTDPGLNSFTTQNWTSSLNIQEKEEWRPWTLDDCKKMGGYITEYENDFSFVTIRGSGHMVPHHKPLPAFELMSNFIHGRNFKAYNATCTMPPSY